MWQVSWGHPKFGGILASCSFDHRVIIWKELAEGSWQQARPQAAPMFSISIMTVHLSAPRKLISYVLRLPSSHVPAV